MTNEAVAPKTRLNNLAKDVPDAMAALQALGKALYSGSHDKAVGLAGLRASQINGCFMCLNVKGSKEFGETDERLHALAVWRESPYFTAAERAALALAEAMTRMSDRSDPVPDAIWDEVARHFKETELWYLVLQISVLNMYNRINVTTRQQPTWDSEAKQG